MLLSVLQGKTIDVKEIAFEEAPKDFRLASGFKDVQFVQLQITDDCVMGDVKKVLTARGEFVVLTKDNEVFCFKKEKTVHFSDR